MRFSIISPSFRSSHWLKLCVASVADQGIEHEHIVQDACSDDATQEWLAKDPRIKAFIEKDAGMYDAVNRGLRRAQGEILAYLNCDEQYLPGALMQVEQYFLTHPEVEVLFTDTIIVNEQGDYICHRPIYVPSQSHSRVANLATLTCSTFFRRSVLDQHNLFFNTEYKIMGDAEWIVRLCQHRLKMQCLNCFTSIFTDTGDNLALNPKLPSEKRRLFSTAPGWAKLARPWLILLNQLRRSLANGHRRPFDYRLYTLNSPDQRVLKHARNPTIRWRTYLTDSIAPG